MKITAKYLITLFFLPMLSTQMLFAGDKISPMSVNGSKAVTTEEAKKLFDDGVLFVDVRSSKAWNSGRISDAVLLDIKSNFTEQSLLAEAKKPDPVVIYCNGEDCLRSAKATEMAVGWGFTNLYYFRDGYPAWKNASYPVE
ncbi:MAG: rhodanese-like domain-containing protein [Gammaproteobacteria bacterium]|nr:rhodanese-like domain-containing protein [Gammaproteobacteria bacterium]